MKYLKCLAFSVAVLAVVSCGDDPIISDDPDSAPFLRIEVVDTDGQPVPDLRIRAWNHLSIDKVGPGQPDPKTSPSAASMFASTVFGFSSPVATEVMFTIYDLVGNIVDTLIDSFMNAGSHQVVWNAASVPSGVYRCQLNAGFFSSSVYAVLHRRGEGPEIEDLGHTSSDGVFETNDSIRFPNTFELPPLIWTDELDDSLGQFSILDSVTIRLTDTTADLSQYFERRITNGSNILTLVWDTAQAIPVPPPAAGSSESFHTRHRLLQSSFDSTDVSTDGIILPEEYNLNQNYPNPFN